MVVSGKAIAAVEPVDSPATPGEVTIDGGGGTLVAGMYEMHGHLGQEDALMNLLAGITTVRDMGNDNAVLGYLIDRIESGEIGGPHVIRSGFIEGKSPFSANNGIVVDSQQAAIDAVRWYGARGYWQIKIYNSMNPAWVPAMVEEAHRLGMRVAGHVPAFATADQMIEAGYDEMTHINQFVLGWVIGPREDTRTLFRLTALKRLPALDLNSAKVQHTIELMVEGHKAIDPTLGIHENLVLNRDGKVPPGAVDYLSHMPIGTRRDAMKALDRRLGAGRRAALPQALRQAHRRGARCCTIAACSSSSAPIPAASSPITASSSSTRQGRHDAARDPQAGHAGQRALYSARTRAWARSRKASSPISSWCPATRPRPQGDQDDRHGGEGRRLLLPERSLSEVRHRAVRWRAQGFVTGGRKLGVCRQSQPEVLHIHRPSPNWGASVRGERKRAYRAVSIAAIMPSRTHCPSNAPARAMPASLAMRRNHRGA